MSDIQPDVSVIIPSYNRLPFLRKAVASCLDGNEAISVEVIVVDDGSTDGTAEWLSQNANVKLRWFRQKNQGAQVARNRGLAECRGEYVNFLDDDDWLATGFLQQAVTLLRNQKADICSGDLTVTDAAEKPLHELPGPHQADVFPELIRGDAWTNPLRFVLATSLARQVPWDEKLPIKQDIDYFFRIGMIATKHVRVPGTVGFVREHNRPRISRTGLHPPLHMLAVLCNVVRDWIRTEPSPSPERISAARDGLWLWIHLCAVINWRQSYEAWNLLTSLEKTPYHPQRGNFLLAMSDHLLGVMGTEYLQLIPRKLKSWIRRLHIGKNNAQCSTKPCEAVGRDELQL